MIRTFIAIPLPLLLYPMIDEVRAACRDVPPLWRWIPCAHIHLTLKFLGQVSSESVPQITQAMQQTVAQVRPFSVYAQGIGGFPSLSRPRVVWMGLEDPQGVLALVHRQLDTSLSRLGFSPDERPFRPHLTLARARQPRRCDTLADVCRLYHERRFGDILITEIHLYRSQLHHDGAKYTVLSSASLQV